MSKQALAVGLLCAASAAVGFIGAAAEIGWTVMAANGVRDIAIEAMTQQGQALEKCRADAAIPPKATNRRPQRFRL